MPKLTPQEFARRWSRSKLPERSGYQQHFLDVCQMLDKKGPAEVDPDGTFYTFEKGVEKTGGEVSGSEEGKGFADVWYRGRFAWEYKGKHKDLAAAYRQLNLYREDLENPPLLVVSDMERFEVHTNFNDTAKKVYAFTNDDIGAPDNTETLRILRSLFEDPSSLKPGTTPEGVTREVADRFAILAEGLRTRGVEPRRAARFLDRLLFCLFAEDVGLLPKGLFTRIAERTKGNPERFARNMRALFGAMAEGGEFFVEDIRHFNGGLFTDDDVVPLEAEEIKVLAESARLDWGSIEPAIFGTLFERSLDPSERAPLGAHYTSREDILEVVEPVLMAPLRREWDAVRGEVEVLAEKMHPTNASARTKIFRQMEAKLSGFANRLRAVRVLDPACGSGNFLYVSLRELLDLEKEISAYAGKMGLTPFFPGVSPDQLFGIETNPYAHELAQVTVWIGYLQWNITNGFGTREDPILGPMTNILLMDAVISSGEDGEPKEPEWPEADVIVGNPPFLGDKRMRSELKDEYVDDLRQLYAGRVAGGADLVTYWFEKARKQIEDGKAKRGGLLATNGIRFGANRRVLERVKATGDIFMAWSDRLWVLEDAAVRVSIVGFDEGSEPTRILNGEPVQQINVDLTALVDVTGAQPLPENEGLCFLGVMKSGPFEINMQQAQAMLSAPSNPNGRTNSDVVKRRIIGKDVTQGPQNSWIIDFGVEMSQQQAALYQEPFEYIRTHVKPLRDNNRRASMRNRWWRHGEARPGLRKALRGLRRCIITPEVAKYRLFAWMDTENVPDHTLHVIAREDDYFFGVLHSRAHELWSLSVGNYMGFGNDPRYNSSRTFKTFPFPWPPGTEPTDHSRVEAIANAAKELDRLRRNWLNPEGASEKELKKRTLTDLYNARPMWLANAHAELDQAVFAAYGWPAEIQDQEILEKLLALNEDRR